MRLGTGIIRAAGVVCALLSSGACAECDAAGAEPAEIAGVEDGLDLLLADGRTAAIVGLDADPQADGRAAFVAGMLGSQARLRLVEPKPDRWGRARAMVFIRPDADSPYRDLAQAALAAGIARYRPDPAARPCRDELLAAERAARDARLGLWRDSRNAALDAADARSLAGARKGPALVEGVVSSIGERRGRLYLNFGPRRTMDFAIVISERNLPLFEAAHVSVRGLVGRRLRVRGLLDRGFGPFIDVQIPDALEILDDARKPPAGAGTDG